MKLKELLAATCPKLVGEIRGYMKDWGRDPNGAFGAFVADVIGSGVPSLVLLRFGCDRAGIYSVVEELAVDWFGGTCTTRVSHSLSNPITGGSTPARIKRVEFRIFEEQEQLVDGWRVEMQRLGSSTGPVRRVVLQHNDHDSNMIMTVPIAAVKPILLDRLEYAPYLDDDATQRVAALKHRALSSARRALPLEGYMAVAASFVQADRRGRGEGRAMYDMATKLAVGLGFKGLASPREGRNQFSERMWQRYNPHLPVSKRRS